MIIGASGAGITAAIEAKVQGAKNVVVLEKMDITGGNTRMSGGEFAAPGNWVQKAEGITNDSTEKYYNDILKGGYNLGNPKLVRIIADSSLKTAEWLRDYIGIKFRNEQSWYGGHEVARTLWPEGDGPAYVGTLEDRARELGVEFYLQTKATEIIKDSSGRVSGVNAEHKDGANYKFNASNVVIITTGRFGANIDMRQEYNKTWPTLDVSIPTTNSPAITEDGINMAKNIGANLVGMEHIQLYPVNNPATGNFNKIGDGPYFMFSSVVSVHHTMGGVEIDELARVIYTNGKPIPGLYAAGEVTGGIHGGNRLSSVAVPDTASLVELQEKIA